jgi:foldase protein PrsA
MPKKFKVSDKSKKLLILLLGGLILVALAYNFKHWVVAAVVNYRPITRFQLDRELERQAGNQVLTNLINRELIVQEAKKNQINVSQQDIDEEVKTIEEELKVQNMDLDSFLNYQGQTRKQFEDQVKIQLMIDKMIGQDIEVTDEEARQYFEDNQEYFAEDADFETMKNDIKESLRQQKLSEKFQTWLEEVTAASKIYNLLEL